MDISGSHCLVGRNASVDNLSSLYWVKETPWKFSLKCFRRFETLNIIMIQGIVSLVNESATA